MAGELGRKHRRWGAKCINPLWGSTGYLWVRGPKGAAELPQQGTGWYQDLSSWQLTLGMTSSLLPLQLQYLNRYYQTIREKVGPELQRRQLLEEFEWLQQHTEPLSARAPRATFLASLLAASTLAILGWSV